MQALLNDIELDVQELKCLIQSMLTDTNPVLRIVAKKYSSDAGAVVCADKTVG